MIRCGLGEAGARVRAAAGVLRHGVPGPAQVVAATQVAVPRDEILKTVSLALLGLGLPERWAEHATSEGLSGARAVVAVMQQFRAGEFSDIEAGRWPAQEVNG